MMTKMKKIQYLIFVFTGISVLLLAGCDPETITQTIYLQDIEVKGPISQPPLHITNGQKAGTVSFSPKVFINNKKSVSAQVEGHTKVNSQGFYQVDTVYNNDGTWYYTESNVNNFTFNGDNLTWNLPDAAMGIDLDICVSNHFAISGGFNYVVQRQKSLIGGSVGLGFYTEKEGNSTRFDAGIIWQSMSYDASSVVVTARSLSGTSSGTVDFFRDRDTENTINFFASLTYNTAFENLPVNFFISAGYFSQTIVGYEPRSTDVDFHPITNTTVIKEDLRGEATAGFLNVTPGIYKDITDWSRVILGVRLLKEIQR
jgi:hypothetical protein